MTIEAAAIMTRNVITVRPDDTVAHVAKVLAEHDISAVPVCEADGQLVGMISEGDLMRPFGQEYELRRSWWLNLLAEGTDLAPEFANYLRTDQHHVRDVMTREIVTATEATSLPAIADLLGQHRIKRVPIVRKGKVVGIVSRADVVRALAKSSETAAADL
jgi:CBS domain-containing protein